MTNTEVHEAVIRWLSSLTGLVFIKDHQGVNRPATPYGMLYLASWKQLQEGPLRVDWEELDFTNEASLNALRAHPIVPMEWAFMVYAYGQEGWDSLRRVQSAIKLSQAMEPLLPKLVVHRMGQINSIPELVDEVWEPRVQANLFVHGLADDGIIVDTIETHDFEFTRVK